MTFTIGTDPEVFLEDAVSIIPAVGLVGGTKEAPIPVNLGAIQEDNVLAEFNTSPANSVDEFLYNIHTVMDQLSNVVQPYKLKVISSFDFNKDLLISLGNQALQFGCDPDYNAWTGEVNHPPSPYTTLRTAGGHVHVGFDVSRDDDKSRFEVIQLMDIFLGIPSVLMDTDTRRRSMYGKAGACRLKSYGAEYRVLSNFWLQSDDYIKWVYSQSKRAVDNLGYIDDILGGYSPSDIQSVINNSNIKLAETIIKDLRLEVV